MATRLPLITFVLLWGSGYVVGVLGVESAPPLGLLAMRFVVAAVVVVPLAMWLVDDWRQAPLGRLAVVGLLLQGVQFAGIYGGLGLGVPAALSALITLGLAPLATTAIAVAVGMEHPSARVWLALAIGAVGVLVSLAPELGSAHVGVGAALTVVGMLGLAGGTVLQKRWAGDADPRVAVAAQIGAVAPIMVVAAAIAGQLDIHPSVQLGLSLAWLVGPLSIGGVFLFVHILGRYEASTTSSLLLVVPAATAVMAVPILGEALSPISLIGMAISIAAVLTVVGSRYDPAGDGAPAPAGRAGPTGRRPGRPGRRDDARHLHLGGGRETANARPARGRGA
jgi:drug/metabolite transporter (DMT)-like permease